MTHEDDVPNKLTKATTWVVGEFAFLDDLLQGLGCKPRAEKHGYGYELAGRAAVHVHVKLKHLSVGLPPELRPEVDALNAVPSVERRHAWLACQPGTCDREDREDCSSAPVTSRRRHSRGRLCRAVWHLLERASRLQNPTIKLTWH